MARLADLAEALGAEQQGPCWWPPRPRRVRPRRPVWWPWWACGGRARAPWGEARAAHWGCPSSSSTPRWRRGRVWRSARSSRCTVRSTTAGSSARPSRRCSRRAHPRAVVATGGSIVTDPATWAVLQAQTFTVWLRATADDHWARVVARGTRGRWRTGPTRGASFRASSTPVHPVRPVSAQRRHLGSGAARRAGGARAGRRARRPCPCAEASSRRRWRAPRRPCYGRGLAMKVLLAEDDRPRG